MCDQILDPLFKFATPPVKRIAANEFALMDAWDVRVAEDSQRFHDEVDNPPRAASRSRLRPDMRLGESLGLWVKGRGARPQSVHETTIAVDDLVAFFGDVPVSSFTKDMLLDYRHAALNLPASMPRADRALSLPERVAGYTDAPVKRIGATTIKKRVGAVQALLGYASQEGWIDSNVGLGLTVEGAGRPKRRRRNFTNEEIAVLFGSELFLDPSGLVEGKTKVSDLTLFRIFLLGIASGARIEEIGQAHRRDVRRRDDVLHIDIDDYVPDDVANDAAHGKSLKTDESRRVIPIHRGAEEERSGPPVRRPRPEPLRQGDPEASRRANRYIDAIVSDDRRLVFHSLRHTFKDAGREADVQERILDQLCGHAPTSIGGKYGSGVGLPTLKRNLDRMLFQAIAGPRSYR